MLGQGTEGIIIYLLCLSCVGTTSGLPTLVGFVLGGRRNTQPVNQFLSFSFFFLLRAEGLWGSKNIQHGGKKKKEEKAWCGS